MTYSILIHAPGGTDVLKYTQSRVPAPAKGEVLIAQTAVGVNFIDIYHRTGLYKLPAYPALIGLEGAGVIEQVGEGVSDFAPGDRVAYAGGPLGAYAEKRVMPAKYVVKLPDTISAEQAAAIMLKGLTALMLLDKVAHVKAGQTVLLHAAAGGVGLLLCQIAHARGIQVIGSVGSPEKAAVARENGAAHTILYRKEDVTKKVREITGGEGVDVVLDSVGKDTFSSSLDSLKPFGHLVCFGQASGPVAPIEIGLLAQKGSLTLSRPTLLHMVEDIDNYIYFTNMLFDLVAKNKVKIHINQRFNLSDAARAHALLESRGTTGALILTV